MAIIKKFNKALDNIGGGSLGRDPSMAETSSCDRNISEPRVRSRLKDNTVTSSGQMPPLSTVTSPVLETTDQPADNELTLVQP